MGDRRSIGPRDAAIGIVRTLAAEGHTAYLAGGCVRDELLGLDPTDYDVATDAPPDRVANLFRSTREVGKSFGVVLVRRNDAVVEVATFRAEGPYSDKRRPDHVRFCSPQEDAERRDFTINALFLDPLDTDHRPGGRIIDFVGGVNDLHAKVVRAVGDPEDRLAEDHLRALRAARFAARLGFGLDPATADAVQRHATDLRGVSRERIGEEMRKMLAHPTRADAADLLARLGLDGPALGETPRPTQTTAFLRALPHDAAFADALAAWMADRASTADRGSLDPDRFAADAPETIRRWRRSLSLSNEESARARDVAAGAAAILSRWPGWTIAQRMRAAATGWFAAALHLAAAADPAAAAAVSDETARLAARPGGLAPTPLITGDDLIAEGLEPGPSFAEWLDATYDEQLEGRIADRGAALAFVRRMSGSSGGRA